MGVILTRPAKTTTTTSSGASGSSPFSESEKLALEMEMEFKTSFSDYYKEFTYTSDQLTNVGIWTDNTKVSKLFNKDLSYTSEQLTQTYLTRISDNAKLLKLFSYTGDNLTSVTVSAG